MHHHAGLIFKFFCRDEVLQCCQAEAVPFDSLSIIYENSGCSTSLLIFDAVSLLNFIHVDEYIVVFHFYFCFHFPDIK